MICLINQRSWHQVGITSYGAAAGCALPGLPGFFTRVSSFVDWIDEGKQIHLLCLQECFTCFLPTTVFSAFSNNLAVVCTLKSS